MPTDCVVPTYEISAGNSGLFSYSRVSVGIIMFGHVTTILWYRRNSFNILIYSNLEKWNQNFVRLNFGDDKLCH